MPAISINSSKKKTNTATIVLVIAVLIVGAAVGFLLLTTGSPSLSPIRKASEITQTQDLLKPITPTPTAVPQLCPIDGATCTWSAVKDASGYSFMIKDLTSGETIKEGVVPGQSVVFTPQIKHTYSCIVKALNSCGEGVAKQVENTCDSQITPTPTVVITGSPTPTMTPATGTPTMTPTPTSTGTLTPTPTTSVVTQTTTTPVPTSLPRAGLLTPSFMIIGIALSIIAMGFVL